MRASWLRSGQTSITYLLYVFYQYTDRIGRSPAGLVPLPYIDRVKMTLLCTFMFTFSPKDIYDGRDDGPDAVQRGHLIHHWSVST